MAIELAELIGHLRAELTDAIHAGTGSDLRFEVGPVELELSIAVDRATDASGKIRFWVLEMGADAKRSSTTTQRIKLTLDPRSSGAKVTIDGAEVDGER